MSLRANSIACACAAVIVGCSTPRIGIEPRFSPSQIEGTLSAGGSAQLSIEDLGLDENGVQAGGRIDIAWGSPHFSLSYTPNSFEGDSTLSAPISLGGTSIAAGSAVQSDLKLDVTSAVLTFDLSPIPTLEAGLGLGIAAVDFRTQVQDVMSGTTLTTSDTLPVPLLAGRVAWSIWRLEANVLASGFTYSSGGQSVSYYDIDAEVRFNFFGHEKRLQGWISAGYRQIGTDFAYDDAGTRIQSDLTLKGPFLGVVLSF